MAKNYDIALLYDFYGDLLTEKRRAVFEDYYDNDLSLSEIAANEGVSRQGIHDTLKKGEEQLRGLEAKLGLAARFRQISEKAEQIIALSKTIADRGDPAIAAAALQIKQTAEELKSLG